jgi:UDP-glucose 4-epimerase
MRVLLTGVTSFTGCHISRALVEAGHSVLATLTSPAESYAGHALKEQRLAYSLCPNFVHDAPFGSENFLAAIKSFKPEVFINHGADIEGYRKLDFDVARSVAASTKNLGAVVRTLRESGCRRVLHSGSVFESIDGLPPFSPYGASKTQVFQHLQEACRTESLALSKISIPNPIGPFENPDRLNPIFAKLWLEGKRPRITTPALVWDYLPAPWLAKVYVEELQETAAFRHCRPSGYCQRVDAFIANFVAWARKLGTELALEYDIAPNEDAVPPRLNTEPRLELQDPRLEEAFWSEWMRELGLVP